MQTVRILNHYRLALSDDRIAATVLALLAKEAAISEEELLKQCEGEPVREVKRAIDRLYRAHYASKDPSGEWRASNLGKDILAHLGLTQTINEYLLALLPVAQEHRTFLVQHIRSKEPASSDSALLASLQVISEFAKIERKLSNNEESLRRLLYATVVGLDPDFSHSGRKGLKSAASRLAESYVSGSSLRGSRRQILSFERASSYCRQAFADVDRSNVYLVEGTETASQVTRLLSWVRLLGAATSESPDSHLRSIALTKSLDFLAADATFSRACFLTAPLWLRPHEPTTDRSLPDWASMVIVRLRESAQHGRNDSDRFNSTFRPGLMLADRNLDLAGMTQSIREASKTLATAKWSRGSQEALVEVAAAARTLASSAERIASSLGDAARGGRGEAEGAT